MTTPRAFLDALPSSRPAPELADVDDVFGFLIGSWDVDAVLYDAEGRTRKVAGEVHASWVLEGRAIQDLFIFPRRADRASETRAAGDRYGTSIRTYDRTRKAWRVNFINPAAEETSAHLVARRNGEQIEMEGKLADGTPIRWRYVTFSPTSFHYTAEMRRGDDAWQLYLELFGQRALS